MISENDQTQNDAERGYTREDVDAFVLDIEKKVLESSDVAMHSILALNHLLREPNMSLLLDESLKGRISDLWIKLGSHGLELNSPPLLFGVPEVSVLPKVVSEDDIDDGTNTIEIVLLEDEEKEVVTVKAKKDDNEDQDDEDEDDEEYLNG